MAHWEVVQGVVQPVAPQVAPQEAAPPVAVQGVAPLVAVQGVAPLVAARACHTHRVAEGAASSTASRTLQASRTPPAVAAAAPLLQTLPSLASRIPQAGAEASPPLGHASSAALEPALARPRAPPKTWCAGATAASVRPAAAPPSSALRACHVAPFESRSCTRR